MDEEEKEEWRRNLDRRGDGLEFRRLEEERRHKQTEDMHNGFWKRAIKYGFFWGLLIDG